MKKLTALLSLIALVAVTAVVALPAYGATTTVKLGDDFFKPTSLTVSKGTTLRFVWTGSSTHNVNVVSGPDHFRSRYQSKGSFTHRMTKPGLYHLVCNIHAGMKLTVRVR